MTKGVLSDHHIQKQIYNRLVGSDSLRYSELKPKNIEANLFMYHLGELIKSGLVEKTDKAYSLTPEGKLMAARFSVREQKLRIMPSTISVIVIRSIKGRWLIYERLRQPFIGSLGWPSGKIHIGETLKVAAEREVSEKCNYDNIDLTLRGEFSLVEESQDNIYVNHVIGHVWSTTVDDEQVFDNHAGKTFWVDDWRELPYDKFISGFKEIVDAMESKQLFLLDLKFQITADSGRVYDSHKQ